MDQNSRVSGPSAAPWLWKGGGWERNKSRRVSGPPAAPAVVVFDDVSCGYGERAILKHVSLSIDRGESVALVGRSGAGKSTLLKLVNRMVEPQGGSVRFEGRDTRDWDRIALRR